jgi:hypothetical protein
MCGTGGEEEEEEEEEEDESGRGTFGCRYGKRKKNKKTRRGGCCCGFAEPRGGRVWCKKFIGGMRGERDVVVG